MASGWLRYALLTTVMWGVWGAFTSLPSEHGFPDTMTYVVWALTMIAPAWWALRHSQARLQRDGRSLALGLAIGLLGAGGQMLLFRAVTLGPTYLIFPIVSLSPVVTILLSLLLLRERTGAPLLTALIALAVAGTLPGPYKLAGIVLALAGALLLSLQPETPLPTAAP